MGPFRCHVFVCTDGKKCRRQGADEVFDILKRGVKGAGLKGQVRVNRAGCMDQCGHGPMVVVYPQDVWYAGVDEKGAHRIVEEHLIDGTIVDRYRYEPGRRRDDDGR